MKVVIDADSIAFICGWNTVFKAWDIDYDRVILNVNNLVSKILINTKAKEYLGFVGKGRGFRKQLFPDYKSNRDGVIYPPYLKEIKQHLIDYWGFVEVSQFEPDDAVCILKKRDPEIIIAAIDKDVIYNIAGNHYNYKTHEWVNTGIIQADITFWKSMICGDSVDSIKGIPKKGEKYIEKVFETSITKNYREIVFEEYIKHYGEYEGIKEFYKSYILLKMLEVDDSFNPEFVALDYNKLSI